MSKKRKEKVIASAIGGSATDVTGSCWSVSYPKKDGSNGIILIELGMIQRNTTILEEYNLNKKMLEKIPMKEAEYVFVNHSHIDHTGNLPALIPNGFNGRVICTYENRMISEKLLFDAAHIHLKNIEAMRFKGKKVSHLYTGQDCYDLFDRVDVYSDNEIHKLDEYVSFRYVENSHVVGAKQLELFITTPSGKVKKILYTSDLGSPMNKELQPFLKDNQIVTKANLAIFESTYGNSSRGFNKEEAIAEREELIKTIKEYIKNERRVFLPVFSYGRMQSTLELLYRNFKDEEWFDIPVVVDSKLANEINDVYRKILKDEDLAYWEEILAWKNIKFVRDYKGTMAVLGKKTPMIVLSSSGMVTAGHSLIYARNFLESKNDIIIFTGYCGEGTIGSKILNPEQKTVTIDGIVTNKMCHIKRFNTFSSHIQQPDLINYLKQINCNKIILHHGTEDAKSELRDKAKEELMRIGKTTPIVCSDKGYQTVVD